MEDRHFWREYVRFAMRYYWFGLQLGVRNVAAHGARLGAKKTLGKIVQPINSPDRFLESFCVWRHLRGLGNGRILDVASPKLLALYAAHCGVGMGELVATDLVSEYLTEYQILATLLTGHISEALRFEAADARKLPYADGSFDAVYSLSVIEHIPDDGDRAALQELVRVVKPGGCVVLTLPFGNRFAEEYRSADVYARKYRGEPLFFQRVYDSSALHALLETVAANAVVERIDVGWERVSWVQRFSHLPESVRALLGPTSLPIALVNYRTVSPSLSDLAAVRLPSTGFVCVALRSLQRDRVSKPQQAGQ